jgi:hypothetical protein
MILVPRPTRARKTPAGSGGANSFQGLKRETAPRAEPLLWVRLTSNQFSVEQAFFAISCCFLATACEGL